MPSQRDLGIIYKRIDRIRDLLFRYLLQRGISSVRRVMSSDELWSEENDGLFNYHANTRELPPRYVLVVHTPSGLHEAASNEIPRRLAIFFDAVDSFHPRMGLGMGVTVRRSYIDADPIASPIGTSFSLDEPYWNVKSQEDIALLDRFVERAEELLLVEDSSLSHYAVSCQSARKGEPVTAPLLWTNNPLSPWSTDPDRACYYRSAEAAQKMAQALAAAAAVFGPPGDKNMTYSSMALPHRALPEKP